MSMLWKLDRSYVRVKILSSSASTSSPINHKKRFEPEHRKGEETIILCNKKKPAYLKRYYRIRNENMIREFFHKPSLTNIISRIDANKEVFSLVDRMRNLSLNDGGGASTSTSTSTTSNLTHNLSPTVSIIDRFRNNTNPSSFTRNIMEMTKAPFIDIQKPITNITGMSSSYMMSLGFRFMPGQGESLVKELRVPETLDGLRNLRDNLGLSLTKGTLSGAPLLKLKGVSDLIRDPSSILASRVLVEAITFHEGYYGRFLVLVQIGVGCTVWYGFAQGNGMNLPIDGLLAPLFSPIENYDAFFMNPDVHVHPGFNKMTLVEGIESPVTTPLTQAFAEKKPFIDIEIPKTNQSIIVGVSLGLAVAILLTFGITPN